MASKDEVVVGQSPKDMPTYSGDKILEVPEFESITISHKNNKSHKQDNVIGQHLQIFSRYRGMLLALLSSFMFSLSSMLVKFLTSPGSRYDPTTVALWRFQGALIPSVVLLVYTLIKERYSKVISESGNNEGVQHVKRKTSVLSSIYPPTDKKRLKMLVMVLLRSILTCNAMLLHFYSLQKLDNMGDALVISSSTPVFVTLFAHYFLGERCGVVPIFSTVMTVLGVVVIAKPPHIFGHEEFDEKTMIGTLLALGCMLFATASYLVLRYIRNVHHILTTMFFGGWGTGETVVMVIVLGVWSWPHCYRDWLAAFSLASLTFTSQMAIIFAMKYEKAGPVSLVRTCDVIFAFFWQICVFDCWPEIYSWIGCSIVLFSLVVTASRKWIETLGEDDANRKRFLFLLL